MFHLVRSLPVLGPRTYVMGSHIYYVCYVLSATVMVTVGWHKLDNKVYDCWPIDADANSPDTIPCGGLEMAWIKAPPEKITAGHGFNVTYSLHLPDTFYTHAVTENILPHGNATVAKDWCHHHPCPAAWKSTQDNCCVYHVNVHSCPQESLEGSEKICGPWIPDDGEIFTHTIAMAGQADVVNWTSYMQLWKTGSHSLIAHIKVGTLQAALEAKTQVVAATSCGDGNCDNDETCDTCPRDCLPCPMTDQIKAAIAAPVTFAFCLLMATLAWFQYQKQKMFWDESWIIDYGDIKPDHGIRGFMGSILSVNTGNSSTINTSLVSTQNNINSRTQRKQIFAQTGIFDGRTVAIKKIQKQCFQLTKTIRREVQQVRGLDHPNLCKFIGGSIEVPSVAIITEYCPKGSLNDVLLNDDIPLNWGFRFSFATDVARAMAYLHDKKIFHGRLKSSNCIIDDRWVVKISDYGLQIFRKEDVVTYEDTYRQQLARVYFPPEVHHCPDLRYTGPTDVYSFAVILAEIGSRNDPSLPDDVECLDPTWRPSLPELCNKTQSENDCPRPHDYIELIQRCWGEQPIQRPTFEQIKKILHRINPEKINPVDQMMNLMEKYSKHLEVLVAERTADLLHEKQKTDRLLYSMLPKSVADDLRQGKPAQATGFSACTIFFSDIVGFTTLSSTSTPIQVVTLLNKLYTTFDEIVDNYDVYKVETIGDAYMVVSGVPRENGDRHASEIASMAVDLVAACETFRIPHRGEERIRIRAGMHSGPVVAGVVGLKMPRYCLFGDTVNTASRMESTGEALKIQCSDTCYQILRQLGGYRLQLRGTLPIKGKGDMTTWWLQGKDLDLSKSGMRQSICENTMLDDERTGATAMCPIALPGEQPRHFSLPPLATVLPHPASHLPFPGQPSPSSQSSCFPQPFKRSRLQPTSCSCPVHHSLQHSNQSFPCLSIHPATSHMFCPRECPPHAPF
ncbi:NPR2 [Branchiostoma lanceolatum]|uniref:guanylate cyclase n=2 Tax=Branchiostoma lanceolatum TaxID=7740 RepID=A0A8J9YW49_BRALA|nr:NPR2 [Branchiostoma lanceolatum]